MFKKIFKELEHHAPFTVFGAVAGVIIMLFSRELPDNVTYNVFYTFHPMHVLLSAFVTTSMYKLHTCDRCKGKKNILVLLLIGYFGSVGIATLSDSVIPYLGEALLNMPHRHAHIGFIEEWLIVNPMAILGIAIAYFRPSTKLPHAAHVLVSTAASLFHILMAGGGNLNLLSCLAVFLFLFLAVWLPCCVSDIVFPLLFIKGKDAR